MSYVLYLSKGGKYSEKVLEYLPTIEEHICKTIYVDESNIKYIHFTNVVPALVDSSTLDNIKGEALFKKLEELSQEKLCHTIKRATK